MGKTWYVQTDLREICFVGNMRLYKCLSKMMISWLRLRDKGNIYLFISYFLFFHGAVFLLTTEWDTGFFSSTCPSLHLPVQIHTIIKSHSCPENQRLGGTTEHAIVGSIPLMASRSQHFQRWISPTNRGDGVNPAPQQLCCKPLHTADPWGRGLGQQTAKCSDSEGTPFLHHENGLAWL